jgi:ATP-dependent exoDNAse (exonuclease V) beta subunit
LYVAATRAKQRLYLFGDQPQTGSFLARLWHAVAGDFPLGPAEPAADGAAISRGVPLRRVPAGFQAAGAAAGLDWRVEERRIDDTEAAYGTENETVRLIGTLVHRVLQRIAQEGLDSWTPERVADREPAIRAQLMALGVPRQELDDAVQRATEAVCQTLLSDRGRWVLAGHPEAVSEWELSGVFGGDVHSRKLDRSFLFEGVRWIVDYKTGTEQERYREQLEQYAELVARLDHRPIRLGLYFPLTDSWQEWAPSGVRRAGSGTAPAAD